MADVTRRSFLQLTGAGAAVAALPESVQRLAAIPAAHRTGTIKDVEHIVILMQENRGFDHDFGTLRGVRGFADPRAVTLPNGRPVWFQPNGSSEVGPFRPTDDMDRTFLPDPPHGWIDSHQAWNGGRMDQWIPAKGIVTMTYETRKDLPYYYALADAFTICDAYFCSLIGPTDPNRYHMWTGWVGNDGRGGGPVITNAEAGYDWSTYPERLTRAGISWKVYQDVGVGLDAAGAWGWTSDPYIGNYGDNSLLYFHQYQNAAAGSPLARGAKTGTNVAAGGTLFDQFRADVASGRLPKVSWIVAPEAYSEHPNWAPDFGVWYTSQFLDILADHPDVWSTTVFLLNYDEAGGFFDHVVPPTPPTSHEDGASTVDTVNEIYAGDATNPRGPYGLNSRVPMLVVSPWSRGGYVNSQVFDHTSVIQFLEARFADEAPGLIETNITPWRRAITGDLTSAFDFRHPNTRFVPLPSTDDDAPPDTSTKYPDAVLVAPTTPTVPPQEHGIRPARALPYALHVHASVTSAAATLTFANVGNATAVLHVRSAHGDNPRSYTVEPGKSLTGAWPLRDDGYDLTVYGPNGYLRRFAGTGAPVEVTAAYRRGDSLTLTITNRGAAAEAVTIADAYTGKSRRRSITGGSSVTRTFELEHTRGWYDLTVTVSGRSAFVRQLAGHVENGHDSISDPALGVRLPLH